MGFVKKAALIVTPERVEEMLQGKFGEYPVYAFFLYSSEDAQVAEFMRAKGGWLHSLSGKDCLIAVLEQPTQWGEGWEKYWKERLGSEYDQLSEQWKKLKPFDLDYCYELASKLDIKKNEIPCIVFLESALEEKVLCLPIIPEVGKYREYFEDVFTAVQFAVKSQKGERIKKLHTEWGKFWVKWKGVPGAKKVAQIFQEVGSTIRDIIKPWAEVVEIVNGAVSPFKG